MAFVHLEQHSHYSLCEGTITLEDLTREAVARGDEYLSLCDTNGFYGIVHFARESRAAGLKALHGVRLEKNNESALCIARDQRGYAYLCELTSRLHAERDFSLRVALRRAPDNVYVITADRELLTSGGPHVCSEVNVQRKGYYYDYLFAREVGRTPVLIHPVYFARPEDHALHSLLRATYHNKKAGSLHDNERRPVDAWWRPAREIEQRYGEIMPEAVAATARIARESAFTFDAGKIIFPEKGDRAIARLRELCRRALPERYPNLDADEERRRVVRARLERELDMIQRKGFASYFLVVRDIVRRARYTCGRGSGAASLVSFLLYITHVDPVRHNLYFERFLNEERPDPPDIDIDFAWDEKDAVTAYVLNKYGERAAMVANHITFSHRSSVREVAKTRGLPADEIKAVTSGIHTHYKVESAGYERFVDLSSSATGHGRETAALWREIWKHGAAIGGTPRFLGLHCGGVVIAPEPIHVHVPVQPSAKGFPMIQWEKEQTEEYGLVKIDVLGNRSLAVVRDALTAIKAHHGVDIRYESFNPLDDAKTRGMLERGETIGVFYVESPAMRQLQRKTGRGDYEHLVIHSSLVRPAANKYIREYIARLKGKAYDPVLPEMQDILKDTYGIMTYQEDITRIAVSVAGFTVGQGDELRRIVSKKNKRRRLLQLKELFYKNLSARGVAAAKADRIWEMIESFGGYSFCKPHSASYALLSYKACYLKAHYPAEFLAAVLSNRGGFYSPPAYIAEARRMGLRVLPPHVNHSEVHYVGRDDVIHVGLMEIKHLPQADARRLLEERRRGGAFRNVLDYMRRTEASLKTTSLLVNAGCFAGLERYSQPQLLFLARKFDAERGPLGRRHGTAGQLGLLDEAPARIALKKELKAPPLREDSPERRLAREVETFGFILSRHPMQYYRSRITLPEDVVPAVRLGEFVGRRVRTVGILVTSRTLMTRKDELMQFLSFEDEDILFETVVFPDAHRRHAARAGRDHARLSHRAPYLLAGKVEAEFGVWYLNVEELRVLGR